MLNTDIEEFSGWDLPYNGRTDVVINPATGSINKAAQQGTSEDPTQERAYRLREQRNLKGEFLDREEFAKQRATETYLPALERQKDKIFDTLEGISIETAADTIDSVQRVMIESREEWEELLRDEYLVAGVAAIGSVVVEQRQADDEIEKAISEALDREALILNERSLIETATVKSIIQQVRDGLDKDLSPVAIQQAIIDVGTFSPERALRISRTVTGSAQSIGQLEAAKVAGATLKIWDASLVDTRELHENRDGEQAPIDGRFMNYQSSTGAYPRFPLDPELGPEDRINCRCTMRFRA
jgi:hypothetical protein